MIKNALFIKPNVVSQLVEVARILMSDPQNIKLFRLGQIFHIISSSPAEFDQYCQVNIERIGGDFVDYLHRIKDVNNPNIDLLIALTYRILVEYDTSISSELPMEIRSFLRETMNSLMQYSKEAQEQIVYARQEMPIAILKRILNSAEIGNLRDVGSIASITEKKIEKWQKDLVQSEATAIRLGEVLEKNTQAFNFVGLHEGFSDLSIHIVREMRLAQCGIAFFGFLVLVPSGIDLWMALVKELDFSKINLYTLVAVSVGTITMTFLFLYFFRIALRKADSCAAQLMQVRLRMSLCRFIQNYADYSTEIKSKNADALSKFEALIFSSIVGTEDKLPSTFDGMDQLSALAKSIRGTKD